MNLRRLISSGLRYYAPSSVGVIAAAALGCMILTGALLIGDSVRGSLKQMVTNRLGRTELTLTGGDRFFRAKLADDLAKKLDANVGAALQLRGLISRGDGKRTVNSVEVFGVDGDFYSAVGRADPFGNVDGEGVVLNETLARRLDVAVGDEVVLRMAKPGIMPRDLPLALDSDLSVAFRLAVVAVADKSELGGFSVLANHTAAMNVFVPIDWLGEKVGKSGLANTLIASGAGEGVSADEANAAIRSCVTSGDVGLELRYVTGITEVKSRRIFIEDELAEAIGGGVGILTYFVNEVRLGERSTPYSMVSAIEQGQYSREIFPEDMQDDEIVINTWLADDLGAEVGQSVELEYFVAGPMRKLVRQRSGFKVRSIVEIKGLAGDRSLMPDFPGIAVADNCRDWKPGIPIDLKSIRDKDEEYWDKYKGTPKAFVTLRAGRKMWANSFGSLTAIRFASVEVDGVTIEAKLRKGIEPASMGLFFWPVRASGLKAGREGTDFGGLFLGLSMFLVVSAVILVGLVFVFGVERRAQQTGMLLAVGFEPRRIRRMFLLEGFMLSAIGAAVGAVAAVWYTKLMIYVLGTVWRDAIAGSQIDFFASAQSVSAGIVGSVGVSMSAVWWSLRKQLRRPARELLGRVQERFVSATASRGRGCFVTAGVAAVLAVVIVLGVRATGSKSLTGVFFGAGALLLIAGISFVQGVLKRTVGKGTSALRSVYMLALRNAQRKRGRSVAVVTLLAAGSFMIVAVGANRVAPESDPQNRDSGTGGFALYAESSIGIFKDLNDGEVRKSLGLDAENIADVKVVQLRTSRGDDASCLNLNRAQRPRLLGVDADELSRRGAFAVASVAENVTKQNVWDALDADFGEDVVPAIGDYATIVWALGSKVGGEIEYVDRKGRAFRLKIVGMLKNSVLQGSLVISEKNFIERFGADDGYQAFLIDADVGNIEAATDEFGYRLRDYGFELTPTVDRLGRFNAVENTYLSIFQILGGLGLALGSIGLGLVVSLNVLERRSELGMLRAVGFGKSDIRRMVLAEHAWLVGAGLICGVVSGLVAVWPAAGSSGGNIPWGSLALSVVGIAISAIVWIVLATAVTTRGGLVEAIRKE